MGEREEARQKPVLQCRLARSHDHETEIEAEKIDEISRAQRSASDGAAMRNALCYIRTVYVQYLHD